LNSAADKLPRVGKTQHVVLALKLRGKRVEGARELQDIKGSLIELRIAA